MFFKNTGKNDMTEVIENFNCEDELLIMEAALLDLDDEDLEMFLESAREQSIAIEEEAVMEKSIIKLDKAAKKKRAYWAAIYALASKKKMKEYKKLRTLWKLEAKLNRKLEQRLGSEATRLAAKSMRKKASSSKVVSKAISKAKALLNNPTAAPGKVSNKLNKK